MNRSIRWRLLPVFSLLFQQLPLSSVPKRSMLP
jgi:hypothetical protein